jgi:hypothetical protein
MDRQSVRVIVYAWGKPYVDRLLNYAVASLLAPGNLPALVESFDCTLVVVTEQKLFNYVASHPLMLRVKSLCAVRLISLDDVIGEPWQYGISVAYALFRGFSDLGAAMTETYLLFLNADFVLADGCYERLIPHMERGDSVVLSPSYCVVEEEVEPILERMRKAQSGALALPPRQLARMIIDHRHNTIRAKTISQQGVHFEYMDQAYWKVDEDTIIGHQMPICMVAMRPETALSEINTFWDWGIVYEFCPSRKLTVLGDSDEFLILELRNEHTHLDLVRLGPTTPHAAAARMSGYLTRYQLDNSRFPLTLHAKSVPSDIDGPRTKLREFLEGVLQRYEDRQLPDHHNHPQWLYHKMHLSRRHELEKLRQGLKCLDQGYNAERARVLRLRDSIQGLLDAGLVLPDLDQRLQLNLAFLGEFAARQTVSETADEDLRDPNGTISQPKIGIERNFAEALQELSERHQAAATALQRRLTKLEETPLPTINDFFANVSLVRAERPIGNGYRRRAARIGTQARARVFGAVPYTRSWHPLHFVYKDIAAALNRADGTGRGILFVGDKDGLASCAGAKQYNHCLRISTAGLLRLGIESAVDRPWCGLCVIELVRDHFQHLRRLHRAVLPHMLPGGRLMMVWVNYGCESGASVQRAVVQAALMEHEGARVRFITSASGWGGLGLVEAIKGCRSKSRADRGAALIAALLKVAPHDILRRNLRVDRAITGNCLGMIIEIDVTCGAPEVSFAAALANSTEVSWDRVSPAILTAE